MARVLVTGTYVDKNNSTYVLKREDGSVFQVIKAYEPFRISNQMREWAPVPEGGILVCKKYGDSGRTIEEFPLIDGKKGLWAISSGAARRGVFHWYREPKTPVDLLVQGLGVSRNMIHLVDHIDETLDVIWTEDAFFDGSVEYREVEDFGRERTWRRVTGGTYCIVGIERKTLIGFKYHQLDRIFITDKVDVKEVIGIMEDYRIR